MIVSFGHEYLSLLPPHCKIAELGYSILCGQRPDLIAGAKPKVSVMMEGVRKYA